MKIGSNECEVIVGLMHLVLGLIGFTLYFVGGPTFWAFKNNLQLVSGFNKRQLDLHEAQKFWPYE